MIGEHDDLEANGKALFAEAGWHADRWHPGLGCYQCVGGEFEALMLPVAHVFLGRRKHLHRREDNSVELVLADDVEDQALKSIARGEFAIVIGIVRGFFWPVEYVDEKVERRVKFARGLDRFQTSGRHVGTRGQKLIYVIAGMREIKRGLDDVIHDVGDLDVDKRCTGGFYRGERFFNYAIDRRSFRIIIASKHIADDAEPRTLILLESSEST